MNFEIGGEIREKMGSRQRFTKEFKDSVVQKILNRGNETVLDVCEKIGIGKSTAENWVRMCVKMPNMKKPIEQKKWTAEIKLKVLIETSGLSETDFSLYLRKEGLYSYQIEEWRGDVLKSLDEARTKPQLAKRDDRDDRIRELEKDLTRMEKALAEAAARMMLQKKADLFWEKRAAEKK